MKIKRKKRGMKIKENEEKQEGINQEGRKDGRKKGYKKWKEGRKKKEKKDERK